MWIRIKVMFIELGKGSPLQACHQAMFLESPSGYEYQATDIDLSISELGGEG